MDFVVRCGGVCSEVWMSDGLCSEVWMSDGLCSEV